MKQLDLSTTFSKQNVKKLMLIIWPGTTCTKYMKNMSNTL